MILAALGAYRWIACAAIAGGLLLAGDRFGAWRVQARWDRAELHRAQVQRDAERANRYAAHAASTTYQAAASAIGARHATITTGLRAALSVPAHSGSESESARLGDLLVPAAAVQRLRDAGADVATDRPAAR